MPPKPVRYPVIDGKAHLVKEQVFHCFTYDWNRPDQRRRWLWFKKSDGGWRLFYDDDEENNVVGENQEAKCVLIKMRRDR